jgi:hypothetical protein
MNVQALVKWAWEDPAGRVQDALSQVRELASTATGPDLAELQDAGVMLSRLAGTLDTGPVVGEDTILGQLAGDTITSQLIELARDAWRHEQRGPHGEWERGGATAVASEMRRQESVHQARLHRMQAVQERQRATLTAKAAAAPRSLDDAGQRVASRMSKAEAVAVQARLKASGMESGKIPKLSDLMKVPPEKFGPVEAHQLVQAQYETELHPKHALHLGEILQKADQHIEHGLTDFRKDIEKAESDEDRASARRKAIVETSVALAGAALAMIIGLFGAPLVAVVAATFGPVLVQIGLERKWELSWPTM